MKLRRIFPLVSFLLGGGGVSKPSSKSNSFHSFCYSPPNTISHCRQTRLSLAIRLHMNFNHTHTHTASYQRLPNRSYFKMIATHRYSLPKTGGIMCSHRVSYSPPSTLQRFTSYMYIYAIAFTAGLNTFQVDKVSREIDNRTSTYQQLGSSKLFVARNVRVQ